MRVADAVDDLVDDIDHDAVMDDPYGVLGVPADASPEELRRAYLRAARQHHPDYYVDAPAAERASAEARMRSVNEAWEIVGDPARRRAFDDARPRPFRPFTPVDDEPDPRDAPDVPYRPAPPPRVRDRATTLGPGLLFGASVVVGGISLATSSTKLLGLALGLFLLSCVGFLVVPILALGRARRDE